MMAPLNEFLCIIPDKPGTLAKRLEVRPQHLEGIQPLVKAGQAVLGGAMFDSHPTEGKPPSFKGSAIMYLAESKEAAIELIKKDIYTVSGVWDVENAQVIPFKSAVRIGL